MRRVHEGRAWRGVMDAGAQQPWAAPRRGAGLRRMSL